MRFIVAALLASVCLAGTARPVQAAFAEPGEEQAKLKIAREIVQIIEPFDVMVATNLKGWEAGIGKAFGSNPAVAKLEAEYPGVTAAGIDAVRHMAQVFCRDFVEKTQARKAKILADRLSLRELDEALSFYGTSVGKRLIAAKLRNLDGEALTEDMAATAAEGDTSPRDAIVKVNKRAERKISEDLAAADHVELLRLAREPFAVKLAEALNVGEQEAVELAANPDPEWLKKQEQVATEAMLKFIDGKQ